MEQELLIKRLKLVKEAPSLLRSNSEAGTRITDGYLFDLFAVKTNNYFSSVSHKCFPNKFNINSKIYIIFLIVSLRRLR